VPSRKIATGQIEPWRRHITALAQFNNVYCKLSGLVTEAGADWEAKDLAPYMAHLCDTFGPDRLMWDSDWPVVNSVSDYTCWHAQAMSFCQQYMPAAVQGIFGNNAQIFYQLRD